MTDLSPSPLMISLVQAAGSLPIFLLSLPAGALADIVDRRRLLIGIQLYLAGVSALLCLAAVTGTMTAPLLLALTLAGGVGAALMGPPWQSIVPEIVPRPALRAAVALNSLGINVSRAIGPAIGGWILAASGAAVAYAVDAVSYVLVIVVLVLWRRTLKPSALGPERLLPAMGAGIRYVLASPEVQRALLRSGVFFLFASAYWALLPLIVRRELGGDAALYGVLLGAIGAGAVTGALVLPRAVRGRAPGAVVGVGTALTALATATLALVEDPRAAFAALFVAGAAWIAVITTLNVTAQSVLPDWVRARGLAVYLTVFFGAMTLGSALWGQVATLFDVPTALLAAAIGGTLAGLAALRVALPSGDADLTPSGHWPEPGIAAHADQGPVMIQVAYRVAADKHSAFLAALRDLRRIRRRDGGYGWQIFQDPDDPDAFLEVFHAPSWREHLRHHARVTKADADVQAGIAAYHIGAEPPQVRHFLPPPDGRGGAA
jgi:MFS family permease